MKVKSVLTLTLCLVILLITNGSKAIDKSMESYAKPSSRLSAMEANHLFVTGYLSERKDDGNYPKWYGGCYINKKRYLCIKIVEGYEAKMASISKSMQNSVVFDITDISFNKLISIQKQISESEYSGKITSARLSQKDSLIYVTLIKDCPDNNKIINAFLKIDDHISFSYGGILIPFDSNTYNENLKSMRIN